MAYLELKGITKRFPGIVANDNVDLAVEKGEIHALVGENGAGKSTLMRILYGLEQPDEGEVRLGGKPFRVRSPSDAIKAGIGMVHQSFQLVPSMSALENIVLGAEPRHGFLLDRASAHSTVLEIADQLNITLPWDARVRDLSLGPQQRVEILKVLYRRATLLIFDEPTTVLTAQEAEQLFDLFRRLAARGVTIILITHKLQEVMAVSRRVTIIRRGHVVGVRDTSGTSSSEIARLMVGEDLEEKLPTGSNQPGQELLSVRGLRVTDSRGLAALKDVNLTVRQGEILGVAGIEGNGQHELVHAIAGLIPVQAGSVAIAGHDVTNSSVRQRRSAGLSLIPADRNTEGVSRPSSVQDNAISTRYQSAPFSAGGLLLFKRIGEYARRLLSAFQVVAPGPRARAANLSGGNIQKLVVARELDADPQLLLAAYPSRGVDIRSTNLIHEKLRELRAQGKGVLLISEDLGEILDLADRVLVLYNGRVAGEVPVSKANVHDLGELMTGGTARAP